MQIVLYYSPIACSLVPYVTLTEAGANFEVRTINLRKGEQSSPDYLKLNPKHKVPVLMVDGQTLTENVAIQIWIARNYPQANSIRGRNSTRFQSCRGALPAFTRSSLASMRQLGCVTYRARMRV